MTTKKTKDTLLVLNEADRATIGTALAKYSDSQLKCSFGQSRLLLSRMYRGEPITQKKYDLMVRYIQEWRELIGLQDQGSQDQGSEDQNER